MAALLAVIYGALVFHAVATEASSSSSKSSGKSTSVKASSFNDVCKICTTTPLDGTCTSSPAVACLQAMQSYRDTVLQTSQPFCSCYTSIASQLLVLCPNIAGNVIYLGSCDQNCTFGLSCPIPPSVFALADSNKLASSNNIKSFFQHGSQKAVLPQWSAVGVVSFIAPRAGTLQACFTVVPGSTPGALRYFSRGAIRSGTFGSDGPEVQKLFTPAFIPTNDTGCSVVTTTPDVLTAISTSPESFYMAFSERDRKNGSVYVVARGQLLTAIELYSKANIVGVVPPVRCPRGDCSAFIRLQLTTSALFYTFVPKPIIAHPTSAYLGKGATGEAGSLLIPFFSSGQGAPSLSNGLSIAKDTALAIMSLPLLYYVQIGTALLPDGIARGQLQDTAGVTAILSGASVFPPSNVTSPALFFATLGAGSICFQLISPPSVGKIIYAYILQGSSAVANGQVFLQLYGPPNELQTQTCIVAAGAQTDAIILAPQSYYVQIYTQENPYGAVRGQLVLA